MKILLGSVLILGLFMALVAAGFLVYGSGLVSKPKHGKVVIHETEFQVEVADSSLKRSKGLSGRENLGESEGMLFIFPEPAFQVFWMKGMRIPIDILWVKGDRVIGFVENAQPEPGVRTMSLKRYTSPEAVSQVLEVRAGTVERLGIEIGDEVIVNY